MSVNSSHGCVKAGVGNSPHAYPAIVGWHIFYEPLDRVISVGAFVDLVALLVFNVRSHVYVLAFRHELSAHVLIDKYVALLLKKQRWSYRSLVVVRAIGRHAV